MSEEKVMYGNPPVEKKSAQILLRVTPSTMKNLKRKAFEDHRRPAELARVIVERYVDR
jgi:hypothetical protein